MSSYRSSCESECRGPNPAAVEMGSLGPPTLRLGWNRDFSVLALLPHAPKWVPCPPLPTGKLAAQQGTRGAAAQRCAEALCKSTRRNQPPSQAPGQSSMPRLSSMPTLCAVLVSKLSFHLHKISFKILIVYKFYDSLKSLCKLSWHKL